MELARLQQEEEVKRKRQAEVERLRQERKQREEQEEQIQRAKDEAEKQVKIDWIENLMSVLCEGTYKDHIGICLSTFLVHLSKRLERNSTKLDRKQDLNILYQICVFLANQKKQDGRPGLWLAETFSIAPLKLLKRIQCNLTGSKISTFSTKLVFYGPIGKTRWPPWPLIGWDIFNFSETAEWNSIKLDRKQDLNILYQVCVFLGRFEKQDVRPGLWLVESISTSPLKLLNGSKISTFSTKFGLIGKQKWPPWPMCQKGGTLYSGAWYVALWASCSS